MSKKNREKAIKKYGSLYSPAARPHKRKGKKAKKERQERAEERMEKEKE